MKHETIVCPFCGNGHAHITYEENRVYQMNCPDCHNAIFHQDVSWDAAVAFFKHMTITDDDRLAEICAADKDGRCVVLPCKAGDTINAFRFNEEKGLHVISDKVTAVTYNRSGYTVRTKSKFYPIKEKDGYDFAPISGYPYTLADYYIGTKGAAEAALKAGDTP